MKRFFLMKRMLILFVVSITSATIFQTIRFMVFADAPKSDSGSNVVAQDSVQRDKGKKQSSEVAKSTRPLKQSTEALSDKKLFEDLVDAWIYAYPLVLMDTIEKDMTNSIFFAPKNRMAYFTVLPGPNMKFSECPNVDALLCSAWFDLSEGPQVVIMPAKPTHRYIMELLDAWTNVIDSFGDNQTQDFPTISFDSREVKYFVLAGPENKETIPVGMKVIQSPTNKVWLINRVLLGPPRSDDRPAIASASRTLYEFETMPLKTFETETAKKEPVTGKLKWFRSGPVNTNILELLPSSSAMKDQIKTFPLLLPEKKEPISASSSESYSQKSETDSPVIQEVEQKISTDTQADLKEDSAELETVDLETEQDLDLAVPTTYVYYKPYRFRNCYVRYAQQAVPSTSKKDKEKNNAHESVSEKIEQKVESVDKEAEKGLDEVKKEGETIKKDVDGAVKTLERDSTRIIDRTMKETGRFGRESYQLGRDAMQYLDRRFRRDMNRFATHANSFFDWDATALLPETRVARLSGDRFFSLFSKLLKENPPTAEDQKMITILNRLGFLATQSDQKVQLEPKTLYMMRFVLPYALAKLRQGSLSAVYEKTNKNQWVVPENMGRYGTDYMRRAIVASDFIGANVPEQILYPYTMLDKDGQFLTGKKKYILHFPAGSTPPTDLLWSLTMYDQNHYLVPNRLNRYVLRSNQPLVYDQDGGLTLRIQHEEPQDAVSNWLPAPSEEFMLMLRIYQPKESVLKGEWTIPAVEVAP